jgi:hypothetical protein
MNVMGYSRKHDPSCPCHGPCVLFSFQISKQFSILSAELRYGIQHPRLNLDEVVKSLQYAFSGRARKKFAGKARKSEGMMRTWRTLQ